MKTTTLSLKHNAYGRNGESTAVAAQVRANADGSGASITLLGPRGALIASLSLTCDEADKLSSDISAAAKSQERP